MPSPFGSYPFDASGVDNYVHTQTITAYRVPSTQDNSYPLGTIWINAATLPAVIYTYVGGSTGWDLGNIASASTTVAGIVTLTDNNEPVATKFYVDAAIAAVVVGAGSAATTGLQGYVFLATNAQALAGLLTTNYAINPASLAYALANGLPIAGSTGSFTTLAASGLASLSGSATILSGGTAINIGSDASADAINIGKGAAARVITIGNVTGATQLVINAGSAASSLTTVGGAFTLNTGAGALGLSTDAAITTVSIGTGAAAKTVSLGSTNTTSTTTINSGSGNVNVTGGNLVIATSAKMLQWKGGAVTDFRGTGVLTA